MKHLINILKGAAIGIGMIIPGVSGGTIAVLLNIYEDMISAISNLKKEFKKSFFFLLPILIGMVLAFAAMYFPLKLSLQHFPLQTITLFVGLMIGSLPKLCKDAASNGFEKKFDIISFIIPLIIVIGICFIPNMGVVSLGNDMVWYSYILLFIMGILASCALVIPGISGSMLLLIFGYYEPLLNTISALKDTPLHALLVLVVFAIGLVIGFFTISKIMNFLLTKHRRVTYWAIVGFVFGSIPAIYISYDFTDVDLAWYTFLTAAIIGIIGIIGSFFLIRLSEKKTIAKEEVVEETKEAE